MATANIEAEAPTQGAAATLTIVNPVAESQADLDQTMRDPPAPRRQEGADPALRRRRDLQRRSQRRRGHVG